MARIATMRRLEVRRLPWSEISTAGMTAGLAGGMLMGAAAMAHAAWIGHSAFFPLRLVGATFAGPTALVGGPAIVIYGVALHLLVSMLLGVLFAALIQRTTTLGPALVGATGFALVTLMVMTAVVVPLVNPTMEARIPGMSTAWFVQHLIFGLGLVAAPALRRRTASPTDVS
jgi:hypothetical protein